MHSGADPASETVRVVPSLGVLGSNELAVLDEALGVELGRLGVDLGIEMEGPVTGEDGGSFGDEVTCESVNGLVGSCKAWWRRKRSAPSYTSSSVVE